MKKLLYSLLCVALVAVSCTKFQDEKSDPVIAGSEMTIALVAPIGGSASDSSFIATFTAPEGTTFYSYLVEAGNSAKDLDSMKLFQVKYKGLAAKTIKFTETTKSTEIVLKGLEPNTTYQVYAIAANAQGTVGPIVNKSITTTNHLAPQPKTFTVDAAKGTAAVTFNDVVLRGDKSTAFAHVTYYRINDKAKVQEIVMPETGISIKGKVVTFTIPFYANGAFATVTWDEGCFVNGVGAKVPAYTAKGIDDPTKPKGVTLRFPTKTWKISLPMVKNASGNLIRMPKDSTILFTDYKTFFPEFVADSVVLATADKLVSMSYVESNRVVTRILNKTTHYDFDKDTMLYVGIPEKPNFGAYIDIEIKEGAFLDAFGNPNETFTTKNNYMYSYGITLNDVVGTYTFTGESLVKKPWAMSETDIVITKAVKAGHVYIKNLGAFLAARYPAYNINISSIKTINARLDGDNGILYILPNQPTGLTCDLAGDGKITEIRIMAAILDGSSLYFSDKEEIQLSIHTPGVITANHGFGPSTIPTTPNALGYWAVDPATQKLVNFVDIWDYFVGTRAGQKAPFYAPSNAKKSFSFKL